MDTVDTNYPICMIVDGYYRGQFGSLINCVNGDVCRVILANGSMIRLKRSQIYIVNDKNIAKKIKRTNILANQSRSVPVSSNKVFAKNDRITVPCISPSDVPNNTSCNNLVHINLKTPSPDTFTSIFSHETEPCSDDLSSNSEEYIIQQPYHKVSSNSTELPSPFQQITSPVHSVKRSIKDISYKPKRKEFTWLSANYNIDIEEPTIFTEDSLAIVGKTIVEEGCSNASTRMYQQLWAKETTKKESTIKNMMRDHMLYRMQKKYYNLDSYEQLTKEGLYYSNVFEQAPESFLKINNTNNKNNTPAEQETQQTIEEWCLNHPKLWERVERLSKLSYVNLFHEKIEDENGFLYKNKKPIILAKSLSSSSISTPSPLSVDSSTTVSLSSSPLDNYTVNYDVKEHKVRYVFSSKTQSYADYHMSLTPLTDDSESIIDSPAVSPSPHFVSTNVQNSHEKDEKEREERINKMRDSLIKNHKNELTSTLFSLTKEAKQSVHIPEEYQSVPGFLILKRKQLEPEDPRGFGLLLGPGLRYYIQKGCIYIGEINKHIRERCNKYLYQPHYNTTFNLDVDLGCDSHGNIDTISVCIFYDQGWKLKRVQNKYIYLSVDDQMITNQNSVVSLNSRSIIKIHNITLCFLQSKMPLPVFSTIPDELKNTEHSVLIDV
ncbi:hypothetical protein WA158_008251 [Blastocystis sp. Blastoise]